MLMNDSTWKAAAAVTAGLLVCGLAARAEAQIVPTVVQEPASTPPSVLAGMKVTCLQGPNVLIPSATCPVVRVVRQHLLGIQLSRQSRLDGHCCL